MSLIKLVKAGFFFWKAIVDDEIEFKKVTDEDKFDFKTKSDKYFETKKLDILSVKFEEDQFVEIIGKDNTILLSIPKNSDWRVWKRQDDTWITDGDHRGIHGDLILNGKKVEKITEVYFGE